ncbi:MAG: hypothetical protein QOI76_3474 [Frankiales bacterium]|nr:hypothetical protein [Frankiales bacterium]
MPVAPLVLSLATTPHSTVPAVADAFGWAAGAIGIATGWPQVARLWVGRRHEGLSLSANVLGVLYATAWLLYGFATHSTVQIITNILGVSGLVAILAGHIALTRPPVRQWLPLLIGGLAVLLVMFGIGARPLGVTASVATISGVAPQVVLLARARRAGISDAAGVSRTRWQLSCVANLLWVAYGLIVADPVIIVNSSVIAAFGAAIVVLAADRGPVLAEALPLQGEYAVAA